MLIFLDKDGKRVSLDDPNAMIAEVKIANEEFIANANTNKRGWFFIASEEDSKPDTSKVLKIDAELMKQLRDAFLKVAEAVEETVTQVADTMKQVEEALAQQEDVEIDEDSYYRIKDDETEYVPCPSRLYAAEYVEEPVFLPP